MGRLELQDAMVHLVGSGDRAAGGIDAEDDGLDGGIGLGGGEQAVKLFAGGVGDDAIDGNDGDFFLGVAINHGVFDDAVAGRTSAQAQHGQHGQQDPRAAKQDKDDGSAEESLEESAAPMRRSKRRHHRAKGKRPTALRRAHSGARPGRRSPRRTRRAGGGARRRALRWRRRRKSAAWINGSLPGGRFWNHRFSHAVGEVLSWEPQRPPNASGL
jgi:hypothetical protein